MIRKTILRSKIDSFTWMFFVLLGIQLLSLWYFKYFPTSDGPSHVGMASIIKNLLTDNCPITQEFYEFTSYPVPNWVGHIILAFFTIFFDPITSEKLLISLYLITFAFGVKSLLSSINPNATFLLIPCLLLSYNSLLTAGVYNFLLGVSFSLFAIAWWIRNHKKTKIGFYIKTCFISLFLYFSHLFALTLFLMMIFVIESLEFLRARTYQNFRLYLARGFVIFATIVPCFILFFVHMQSEKMPISGVIPISERFQISFLPRIIVPSLILTEEVYKYSVFLIITLCFAAWFSTLMSIYNKVRGGNFLNFKTYNYFSLGAVLLFLSIFFSPVGFAGSWMIQHRLQFLFFLFLILSFCTSKVHPKLKYFIAILAFIFELGKITLHLNQIKNYQVVADEFYIASNYIPENSSFLSVFLSPYAIDLGNRNFITSFTIPDLSGYFYNEKCRAGVYNYHASEKNAFPISHKDNVNPQYHLGKFRTLYSFNYFPPYINISNYEKSTGKQINYIIVNGKENLMKYNLKDINDSKSRSEKNYHNIMQQIDKDYKLVYTSKTGTIRVYKNKVLQK